MTTKNLSYRYRSVQNTFQFDSRPGMVPFRNLSSFVDYDVEHYWSGQDTPGWKWAISHGGAPFGDFAGFRMSKPEGSSSYYSATLPIYFVNGLWQQKYIVGNASSGFSNCLLPVSYGFASSQTVNSAKAKYVQKGSNVHRAVQGGVIFGELKETIHMIHGTASLLQSGLSSYFSALKKGRRSLRNARKKTKLEFIREQYLQYTYGWGPLMSDVKSGAEALARYRLRRPERTQVRANASKETQVSKTPWGGTIGGFGFGCRNQVVDTTDVHLYGAYDTSVPESNSPTTLTGTGLRDFVPTIWELIPYSFLVDYFTNIGTIISAYSYVNTGLIYSGMSIKVTRRCTATDYQYSLTNEPVSLNPLDPHNGVIEVFSAGRNAWVSETMTRVKNPDLTPSLEINLSGLSPKRILNIIALLPNFRNLTPF